MIEDLVQVARIAGREIISIYNSNFEIQTKSDQSPVTRADLTAHAAIMRELHHLDPSIPVLSEESASPVFSTRRSWKRYWLVDPLDGTKNFVERNDEFTVNIALIENGMPLLGVVGVPIHDCVYTGDVAAGVAMKHIDGHKASINSRRLQTNYATLLESRHNTTSENDLVANHLVRRYRTSVKRTQMGSSLKICTIAEGKADLYLRIGATSEWDIAASSAVLTAAGGDLRLLNGTPKRYNQQDSVLNASFFACGDKPDYWTSVICDALPDLSSL
ncbi:MAG: 3'(2'),5'-bisphosphate nucleotidase CysQ [Gammaproteobacteria bacterium]|nr:3'(2'),5'-bisphosphate nucleotidase CysQ [Gammaproteobacteria bacterium]